MSNKPKLSKLFKKQFPNDKNRVYTMCQTSLAMVTQTMDEAEKLGLTNEQFYQDWEDALNLISVKDHNGNEQETKDFTDIVYSLNKNMPEDK